jgi:hypothetical protein
MYQSTIGQMHFNTISYFIQFIDHMVTNIHFIISQYILPQVSSLFRHLQGEMNHKGTLQAGVDTLPTNIRHQKTRIYKKLLVQQKINTSILEAENAVAKISLTFRHRASSI